jgi:hypothetical protein
MLRFGFANFNFNLRFAESVQIKYLQFVTILLSDTYHQSIAVMRSTLVGSVDNCDIDFFNFRHHQI